MMTTAEMAQGSRFRFGANWQSYSGLIDADRVAEAERSLTRLLQRDNLTGARFLDIGCGSGLFSLAARNLGASVHSFDYDQDSVDCTAAVKAQFRRGDSDWTIEQGSILDNGYVKGLGKFDIVYAWGVLHHTGDMRGAIRIAATLVAPSGILAMALYRRTPLCWLWRIEKRWYSKASPRSQRLAESIYMRAFKFVCERRSMDWQSFLAQYADQNRGMDFATNARDWLGGYPYESTTPAEVDGIMARHGFETVRRNVSPRVHGLWGARCDEFVFQAVI